MQAQFIPDESAMLAWGAKLAQDCSAPLVIFLYGQLGAGKTTLVRGFLRGLGYTGKVKSPSYNLVESYEIQDKSIFHFDFYRIQNPRELDFIGIQDYWHSSAIFLVEWPEKGLSVLPPVDIACYLEISGAGRMIRMEATTEQGIKSISN